MSDAAVRVPAADQVAPVPHRPWARFARHFGEMVLAMTLGMGALGGLAGLFLMPFGASLGEASTAVLAIVMAVSMTVPMVGWMHVHHRMAVGRSVEMTGAMVVPTIAAIALHEAGTITEHGVMVVQHVAMLPAMLAVMLWRRDAYTC